MSQPEILSPAIVTAELVAAAPKATGSVPETAHPPAPVQPASGTAPAVEPVRDRLGRVFDSKRFRTNPDGTPFKNAKGDFMPRGGRKGGSTAPTAKTTAKEPPPVNPSGPAWSDADRAAATKPPTAEGQGESATKTVEPEVVGSADDSAEVACRALYNVLGFATDAPEEAMPTPAEHKNMQSMTAAYFRSRGWVFAGGVAVCIALLAYLLRTANRPKTRARVRGWFGFGKPVEQAPDEPQPAPEPPPVQKSQPSSALSERF
jgi:hypothetical protein